MWFEVLCDDLGCEAMLDRESKEYVSYDVVVWVVGEKANSTST